MCPTQIIDVKHCRQGNHVVPTSTMVWIRSDDGKTRRQVCQNCYDKTMEIREQLKKQLAIA